MMYKKLVAAGIMATMVTGASLTALAAGPDFDMGGMEPPAQEMEFGQHEDFGPSDAPFEFEQGEAPEAPSEFEQGGALQAPFEFEQGGAPETPLEFVQGGVPEAPFNSDQGGVPEQNIQSPMGMPDQQMNNQQQNNQDQMGMPDKQMNGQQQNNQGQMGMPDQQMNGQQQNNQSPMGIPGQQMNGQQQTGQNQMGMPGQQMNGQQQTSQNQMGMPGQQRNGQQQTGQNQMGMPGQQMNGQNGMPGGNSSAPTSYTAASTVTTDANGQTYTSTKDEENVILVDGSKVTLSNITVSKTGDSSGEDSDFYGINAGILADNGATLTITGSEIVTDGAHANGVFSYGENTTVQISDSTITTTGNNSGGLMTTGGATLIASNASISTAGNSSAAIRTDRGGGTVDVTDSTGTTSGVGSPAIYSTADISVSGSTLSASTSEAVVIEGGNSVTITDSDLTGNNSILNGQSTTATNVLIYQSMSGDAQEGASEFVMSGGSLTALTGSMFHVTNVTTTIDLTNVTLNYADDCDVLLDITADSWGTSGKNGGNATVNLTDQTAEGDIIVDGSSSLTLNIGSGSSYTGSINSDGASGSVSVSLSSDSTWTLTGDTYIDSFEGSLDNVEFGDYKMYINGLAHSAY